MLFFPCFLFCRQAFLGLLHSFAFFRQESADKLICDLVKTTNYAVFDSFISGNDAILNGLVVGHSALLNSFIDLLGTVGNFLGNLLGPISGLLYGKLLAADFCCLRLRLQVHGVLQFLFLLLAHFCIPPNYSFSLSRRISGAAFSRCFASTF